MYLKKRRKTYQRNTKTTKFPTKKNIKKITSNTQDKSTKFEKIKNSNIVIKWNDKTQKEKEKEKELQDNKNIKPIKKEIY